MSTDLSMSLSLRNLTIKGLIMFPSGSTRLCFTSDDEYLAQTAMLVTLVLLDTRLARVSGSDLIVPTVIVTTSVDVGESSVKLTGLVACSLYVSVSLS